MITVTGYCVPLTIGTIRISNRKMSASGTREAGLCATPDNSVNITISFRFLHDASGKLFLIEETCSHHQKFLVPA